jgi:hypothetical protein
VYRYDDRIYDYYQGSGPKGTHASSPPKTFGKSALGATPEQAAWKLPSDAVKIGSGAMPKGRIASSSTGMGLGDIDLSTGGKLVAALGIAYLAWKAAKK